MQETWVWSLDWENPLEEELTTHSSILAWEIPWTEKPGGLQSIGLQRVEHDWNNLTAATGNQVPSLHVDIQLSEPYFFWRSFSLSLFTPVDYACSASFLDSVLFHRSRSVLTVLITTALVLNLESMISLCSFWSWFWLFWVPCISILILWLDSQLLLSPHLPKKEKAAGISIEIGFLL